MLRASRRRRAQLQRCAHPAPRICTAPAAAPQHAPAAMDVAALYAAMRAETGARRAGGDAVAGAARTAGGTTTTTTSSSSSSGAGGGTRGDVAAVLASSSASPAGARAGAAREAPAAAADRDARLAAMMHGSMLASLADAPLTAHRPAVRDPLPPPPTSAAPVPGDAPPPPIVLAECADADALLAALRRDLVMLSADGESAAPAARRGAMRALTTTLWGYDFTADAVVLPARTADGAVAVGAGAAPVTDAATRVRFATHEGGVVAAALPALYKMLCRRVSDAGEAVRLGAVQTLTAYLATNLAAREVPTLVPYLVPALASRAASAYVLDVDAKCFAVNAATADAHRRGRVLEAHQGSLALHEDDLYRTAAADAAEAVRLATARALTALVEACTRYGSLPLLDAYWHDIMMAAHALATDAAPEVREAGAATLVAAARAVPHVTCHYAVATVKSLMVVGLPHRLARVRLATLAAIEELVAAPETAKWRGGGSEALMALLGTRDANVVPISAFYRHDTSVNYFARLIVDPNAEVRHRFVRALSRWMTTLLDRHEWWGRLLPYLLSSLCDDGEVAAAPRAAAAASPAAAGRPLAPEDLAAVAPTLPIDILALATLATLGAEHEKEHMDKLLDRIQAGIDGDAEVDYGGPLPPPFQTRPRLGVRLFVRAHAPRFIKAILAEIGEFEPFTGASLAAASGINTRVRAAQLLCHTLVLMEEQITQDANLLLPALVAVVHDVAAPRGAGGGAAAGGAGGGALVHGDDSIALYGAMAARLVGRYVPPTAVMAQLLPFVTGAAPPPPRRGALADPAAEHAAGIGAACHVLWLCVTECRATRLLPVLPSLLAPSGGLLHADVLRTVAAAGAAWCRDAATSALIARVAGTPAPAPAAAAPPAGAVAPARDAFVHWLQAAVAVTAVLTATGGGVRAVAGAVFDATGRLVDAALRDGVRTLAHALRTAAGQLALTGAARVAWDTAPAMAATRTRAMLDSSAPLAVDAALCAAAAAAAAALQPPLPPVAAAGVAPLLAGLTPAELTAALQDCLSDYPSAPLWSPACAPHAQLTALMEGGAMAAMLSQGGDVRAAVVDMCVDVGVSLAGDVGEWLAEGAWAGHGGAPLRLHKVGTTHVVPLDDVVNTAPRGAPPAAMLLPFIAWLAHVLPHLVAPADGGALDAAAAARLASGALGREVTLRAVVGGTPAPLTLRVPLLSLVGVVAGCEPLFLAAATGWLRIAERAAVAATPAAVPLAAHLLLQAAVWTTGAIACIDVATCAAAAAGGGALAAAGVRRLPIAGGADVLAAAAAALLAPFACATPAASAALADVTPAAMAALLAAAAVSAATASSQQSRLAALDAAAAWLAADSSGGGAADDVADAALSLCITAAATAGADTAAATAADDDDDVFRPATPADELTHRAFIFAARAPARAAAVVAAARAPHTAAVCAALEDHLALLARLGSH